MIQVCSNRNVFSNSVLISPVKKRVITRLPIHNVSSRSLAHSFVNHSFMAQSNLLMNSQLTRSRSYTTSRIIYRSVTPQVRLYVRNKIYNLQQRICPPPIKFIKSPTPQFTPQIVSSASSRLYPHPQQQQIRTAQTERQEPTTATDRQNKSTFQLLKKTLQNIDEQEVKYKPPNPKPLHNTEDNINIQKVLQQQPKQYQYFNLHDQKKDTIYDLIDNQKIQTQQKPEQEIYEKDSHQIRLYSPPKEQSQQQYAQLSNKKSSSKKHSSPVKTLSQTNQPSPEKNYAKMHQQKQYQDLLKNKRTKGKMKEMFNNYQMKAIPHDEGYYTQITLKKGKKKKKNCKKSSSKPKPTNKQQDELNKNQNSVVGRNASTSLIIDLKKKYQYKNTNFPPDNSKKDLLIKDIEKLDQEIQRFMQESND